MGRFFNPIETSIVAEAFRQAEKMAGRYFRIEPSALAALKYDVRTLAYLDRHEKKEGAFAHLCKYEYRRGHFWRICLHDHRILDAVYRAHSFIKLASLMMYIAAHEMIHVVRFDSGQADFFGDAEQRIKEEKRVHDITVDMLQPLMTTELKLVTDCFSNRYQIGDIAN